MSCICSLFASLKFVQLFGLPTSSQIHINISVFQFCKFKLYSNKFKIMSRNTKNYIRSLEKSSGYGNRNQGKGKAAPKYEKIDVDGPPVNASAIEKFLWKCDKAKEDGADQMLVIIQQDLKVLIEKIPLMDAKNLEKVIAAVYISLDSFREDIVHDVLSTLKVIIPKIFKTYIPAVQRKNALMRALTVLLQIVKIGFHKPDIPKDVQVKMEAAMERCDANATCKNLWADLQVTLGLRSIEDDKTHIRLDQISITPIVQELLNQDIEIPSNRTDPPWTEDEVDNYLKTHFLLLREEMLQPLRDCVASFLLEHDEVQDESLTKYLDNVHLSELNHNSYEQTRCTGFAVSKSGRPYARFRFKPPKNIDFTAGKNLIYGSLVILFAVDEHQGCVLRGSEIYATVEEFDLFDVTTKHEIGLTFVEESSWNNFDVSAKYIMLESPSYFHAVEPVLRWLQNRELILSCPLWKQLLSGEALEKNRSNAPTYLQGVKADITCLYHEGRTHVKLRAKDPLGTWPNQEDIMLDPSQANAMNHILHSPVALTQGPPGCGKSFLGLRVAQIALSALTAKYKKNAGPIVIVCLTNHALDQFLESLLHKFNIEFERGGMRERPKTIRFGGQSKSDSSSALQGCMIHNFIDLNYDERQERNALQAKLESNMEMARSLQAKLSGTYDKLISFISVQKKFYIQNLFSNLSQDLVERGLFSYHPLQFITAVVSHWVAGHSIEETEHDVGQIFAFPRDKELDLDLFKPRDLPITRFDMLPHINDVDNINLNKLSKKGI